MLAARPTYHPPATTAKALSTLELIAPGRISLNVVSSWWREEAGQYGVAFDEHDARYERTAEWLHVLRGLLTEPKFDHHGAHYRLTGTLLAPKPAAPPTVWMGGESPRAKQVIAAGGDAYVMHGDPPEVIAAKIAELSALRAVTHGPPLRFGVSGFVVLRDTEQQAQDELARILDVRSSPEAYASYQDFVGGSQLESQVSLREYSVSNRGLRAGLVGTPAQVTARLRAYADAGVDLMLLQFSPQHEEMARFARDVLAHW
jgi:FMNH2-dependent dimethyl sulfone monooxygenase